MKNHSYLFTSHTKEHCHLSIKLNWFTWTHFFQKLQISENKPNIKIPFTRIKLKFRVFFINYLCFGSSKFSLSYLSQYFDIFYCYEKNDFVKNLLLPCFFFWVFGSFFHFCFRFHSIHFFHQSSLSLWLVSRLLKDRPPCDNFSKLLVVI